MLKKKQKNNLFHSVIMQECRGIQRKIPIENIIKLVKKRNITENLIETKDILKMFVYFKKNYDQKNIHKILVEIIGKSGNGD